MARIGALTRVEVMGSIPISATQGDVGNVLLQIEHPKKTVDKIMQMCYN